ncbi:MAG: C1 family peptidase [Methylomonas sp.]|jgi:C1A family cysteine protease
MIEINNNVSNAFGAVRNQGMRGTCLAFASSDLNQYINLVGAPLSVEYLAHHAVKTMPNWQPSNGLEVEAVLKALNSPGQPEETKYPYQQNNQSAPLVQVPSNLQPLYTANCKQRKLSFKQINEAIESGKSICIIVFLSDTFRTPNAGIVEYSSNYYQDQLHALLIVGLGKHKHTGEMHVLIRNSWGDNWGLNGHAWLSQQYLAKYLIDSFA